MKLKDSSKTTRKFSVTKFRDKKPTKEDIEVVVEKPFQLLINDDLLATIMLTPANLEEFLVGFLIGQGIVGDISQIKKTLIEEGKGILYAEVVNPVKLNLAKTLITSGCAGGVALDDFNDIAPLSKKALPGLEMVGQLMKEMLAGGQIYPKAGGVHSACLADDQGIIFIVEDIGRHNCIDKVIGYLAKNQIDSDDKFILTTGRLSIEAVSKTVRAKVGTLGSRSTPTNLAVELAEKLNLNFLGYIRAGNLINYTSR